MTLYVDMRDKVARLIRGGFIICDNSDYVVNFTFDEEWDESDIKTARFIYGDTYEDVVFEGNSCGAQIQTTAKKRLSWGSTYQARIMQVYLTVEYEIVNEGTGIYIKQNGAYKQAQNAYKKVSGVWVKQDASTLKTEMQSGGYILG